MRESRTQEGTSTEFSNKNSGHNFPIESRPSFYEKLLNGYRMDKPGNCPVIIYRAMSECWAAEPGGRPSFKKLMDLLGDILDEGERDNYLDLSHKFDITVGKSVGATDNKGYLEGMRGCDYGTQARDSVKF